jgi:type II secretory pathway component PulF
MRYVYKARNTSGILTQGTLDAESREEAVQKILRDGFSPVEVEVQGNVRTILPGTVFGQGGRTNLNDLGDFLRRFSDLIAADIPLVRALQMVEKRTSRIALREAVVRIIGKVQDGVSLSAALASEPKVFPSFWPGLVRAGEISGRLKGILGRLSQLVEKEREAKARLISGAVYPLLILIVGFLIVFALLTFVVPKLAEVFTEMGQDLPLMTKMLLMISGALSKTWWLFLLVVVVAALWIKSVLLTVAGRLSLEKFLFRVPFWGEFIKTDDMERLARTIGILLESGVETVAALECGAQTLKRETFKVEMAKTVNAVRQGVGLSTAFAAAPVFSEDVVSMIGVGEESGKGAQGFLQWAEICERRLEYMTKTATALLEPALILFLGVIFGFIVMALLLPIFNMSLGVK